jgi:hypothetical protein
VNTSCNIFALEEEKNQNNIITDNVLLRRKKKHSVPRIDDPNFYSYVIENTENVNFDINKKYVTYRPFIKNKKNKKERRISVGFRVKEKIEENNYKQIISYIKKLCNNVNYLKIFEIKNGLIPTDVLINLDKKKRKLIK